MLGRAYVDERWLDDMVWGRAFAIHQVAGRFGADALARRALGVVTGSCLAWHDGDLFAGSRFQRGIREDFRR